MNSTVQLQLLGAFRLTCDTTPINLANAPRLQSLLTYLALQPPLAHQRQQLAFRLWPDSSDKQAQTNLRKQIYRLRHEFPEIEAVLAIDPYTILRRPEISWSVDAVDLETAITCAAASQDRHQARALLEQAIRLYQGELLPGGYDEWLGPPRERLQRLYGSTLEQLTHILADQGDDARAIDYAHRLLQHDPLHEESYRQLMQLYARTDHRSAALRTFHTCAEIFGQELGVEPSAITCDLYEQIRRGESPCLRPAPIRKRLHLGQAVETPRFDLTLTKA